MKLELHQKREDSNRSDSTCQDRLEDTSWLMYSPAAAAAGCSTEVLFILHALMRAAKNVLWEKQAALDEARKGPMSCHPRLDDTYEAGIIQP